MSKIIKPEHIIFIGANLYTDFLQRSYLERVFPYIKDARHTTRYPSYSKEQFNTIIKDIKHIGEDTTIFVLDTFFETIIETLKKHKYKIFEKNSSLQFSIGNNLVFLKQITLFKQLPSPTKMISNNLSYFKIFGNQEQLEAFQKKISTHAVLTRILPNCYNAVIKDAQGEQILTETANELGLKVLPARSLKASLIHYLTHKKKTLTMAESCTGGLLASKITSVNGASRVLKGSMVTYSNEIKHQWLGVSKETLKAFGAVSAECVSEMLDGIQKAANASIAVAISGIAGPTGGSKAKPVGTVFIGVLNGRKKTIKEFHFQGDRGFIQELSARSALEMIIDSEEDFFNFF